MNISACMSLLMCQSEHKNENASTNTSVCTECMRVYAMVEIYH